MTEHNPARNREQRIIDEIDALVEWQIEEGHRRGDGPRPSETAPTSDNDTESVAALHNAISRVCAFVNGVHRLARTIPLIAQSGAAVGELSRIRGR
ncbi:hypothetical protein HJ581_0005765 [Rhodococcus opacus]|jgi:hypothetical protein|uniref:Uncharacterized protein n=1 Tax=Rhodococcus opacus TaxID=37919 RepID=A0AAX3Y694_RHOOP|nr:MULTISPECIES: hypothetical protein [Rhodococcus]NHU41799.1 hypothetical protein [Rhodococcus sp. A14]MCZ4586356.1 hypothetical protein [Rhodococcus opacus]MDI9940511.1 hypothetical protein [Rhodococcus sp. IEGM 1351]WKN53344.1 hypothetical protein HJ581_0005765 [Rhodococcus opacus]WLF44803.1 hypothetical protein Q5707_23120 [Rhodococcus opacus]